jgi:hypothetical protein
MTAIVSAIAAIGISDAVAAPGNNGTTLAATKTIDICTTSENLYQYSGVVAVWNQGAVDTVGFNLTDTIQNKAGSGQFRDMYNVTNFSPSPAGYVIPKGSTQQTAVSFTYTYLSPSLLAGDIRNVAHPTILNHSNYLGTAYGPEPKATWLGGTPQPCSNLENGGCTYTQGYWGSKPNVVWPSGYSRNAPFFLATDSKGNALSWQNVLDLPPQGNGYYILGEQYIAAVLNIANSNGVVPSGIKQIVDQATAWFGTNYPAACNAGGSCGTQKTWASILDTYNNGNYPGGPKHCGDEALATVTQ